jgi:hypothetical protein
MNGNLHGTSKKEVLVHEGIEKQLANCVYWIRIPLDPREIVVGNWRNKVFGIVGIGLCIVT